MTRNNTSFLNSPPPTATDDADALLHAADLQRLATAAIEEPAASHTDCMDTDDGESACNDAESSLDPHGDAAAQVKEVIEIDGMSPYIASMHLRRRYLWFLHLCHSAHESTCSSSISRHITALNHPLRWRTHVLSIERMLELVVELGGVDAVSSWRDLAEKLGFNCRRATSIASRLKRFFFDNHFDEFLARSSLGTHENVRTRTHSFADCDSQATSTMHDHSSHIQTHFHRSMHQMQQTHLQARIRAVYQQQMDPVWRSRHFSQTQPFSHHRQQSESQMHNDAVHAIDCNPYMTIQSLCNAQQTWMPTHASTQPDHDANTNSSTNCWNASQAAPIDNDSEDATILPSSPVSPILSR